MLATEVLKLRCLRCGDWHEREAGDPYTPELCGTCFSMGLDLIFEGPGDVGIRKYERWRARWEKAPANHPTRVALEAAWERLGVERLKPDVSPNPDDFPF